ncbi:hypothetical protein KJ564_14590, partial [bacterium]|nr:hypothetical protein [bacterium]
PYWVKYYGNGQQNRLQAEFNRTNALATLADTGNGEGYYYFLHDPGDSVLPDVPANGKSLLCQKDSCQNSFTGKPGVFISGVKDSKYDTWLDEPKFDIGMNAQNQGIYGYFQHGRNMIAKPSVAIYDTNGLASTDTVLEFNLSIGDTNSNWTDHWLFYTRGMFPDNYVFINDDTVEAFLPPNYSRAAYEFKTTNKCDVLVDYVEYMDKEQAYPLHWSSTTRAAALQQVEDECQALVDTAEYFGTEILGFDVADGPRPSIVTSVGVINEFLFAGHATLGTHPPRVRFLASKDACDFYRYREKGKPQIFDAHFYPFAKNVATGNQDELDSLANGIELAYNSSKLTNPPNGVPFIFKAQAHDLPVALVGDPALRNPTRSEIFVQAWMALAHGAKGIMYFKYATSDDWKMRGLVLPGQTYGYALPDTGEYKEKYYAVQEVFTQLDDIGDNLLALERDTAFCVEETPNGFLSPLTSVYFEDDTDDYIEIGQFHDTTATPDDYLIIVNRRTDADRHITIETDLTGANALLDLYTQERFLSSTGNFKSIPFDSGEGRVFKVEEGFDAETDY